MSYLSSNGMWHLPIPSITKSAITSAVPCYNEYHLVHDEMPFRVAYQMFVVTDTGSKVNDCTLSYHILLSIFLRFQSNFVVSVSTCVLGLSLIFRFTRVHVCFMQYFKTKTVITSLYCGFSK